MDTFFCYLCNTTYSCEKVEHTIDCNNNPLCEYCVAEIDAETLCIYEESAGFLEPLADGTFQYTNFIGSLEIPVTNVKSVTEPGGVLTRHFKFSFRGHDFTGINWVEGGFYCMVKRVIKPPAFSEDSDDPDGLPF